MSNNIKESTTVNKSRLKFHTVNILSSLQKMFTTVLKVQHILIGTHKSVSISFINFTSMHGLCSPSDLNRTPQINDIRTSLVST